MPDEEWIHPAFLPQDLQSDLETNLNFPSTVSNDIYEGTIPNYRGELAELDLEHPYPSTIVNSHLHGQRAPASRSSLPESPRPAKRSRVFCSRETLLTEARQLLDKADNTVIAWVVDQLKNRNHLFQQDESDGGHLYTGDSIGVFDNAPISAQLDTTAMDFTYPQDFCYAPEPLQQAQQLSLSWNPTASPHHASSNLQRNPSSMPSSYNNGNFDITRGSIQSSRSSESSLFDPSLRSKHSSATTISSFTSSIASVDRQSSSVYGSNRNTTHARSTIRSGLSNITNVSSDNKLKPDTTYECTYHPCTARFKQKGDWKRHEASLCAPQQLHTCNLDLQSTLNSQPCPNHPDTLMTLEHLDDAHNSHVCPQSTRTTRDGGSRVGLRSRSRNRFENTRLDKLRDHLSEGHRLPLKKVPSTWISDIQGKQTEWGCGFCKTYLRAWDERANHIGDHFADDGKTMEKWSKVLAEQGLLGGRGRVGMAGGRGGRAKFTEDFLRQTARLSRELRDVRIEDEYTEEDKDLFD